MPMGMCAPVALQIMPLHSVTHFVSLSLPGGTASSSWNESGS